MNARISEGIKAGFDMLFDRIETFIQEKVDMLVTEKMKTFMEEEEKSWQQKNFVKPTSTVNSLMTYNL